MFRVFVRLIHHQLDGRVATQSPGIGAGFVGFVHDALNFIDGTTLSDGPGLSYGV
jgi:hypothetical protein